MHAGRGRHRKWWFVGVTSLWSSSDSSPSPKRARFPKCMRWPTILARQRRWTGMLATVCSHFFASSLVEPESQCDTWCRTDGKAPQLAELFGHDPRQFVLGLTGPQKKKNKKHPTSTHINQAMWFNFAQHSRLVTEMQDVTPCCNWRGEMLATRPHGP